jgi:hypothetical protein
MKMSEAFPSKYMKADVDVPETSDLIVTISHSTQERIGQGKEAEDKVILWFHESEKGLVLNKTNWGLIDKALNSDDTDQWTGKRIALFSTDVQFQSDFVRAIRVRPRPPGGKIVEKPAMKVADEEVPY